MGFTISTTSFRDPYQSFLVDILTWLSMSRHSTEIVVVSTNFQGLALDFMKPSVSTLNGILAAAQQTTRTQQSIVPGNRNDLTASYASLIAAKKRLIFLNQIGAPDDAVKYDSYNDNYKTANVQNILNAIGAMNKAGQVNSDYTVLQLQGTASALGGGVFSGIATMSDASSPLLSTKAGFDNQTYAWLPANVPANLSPNQLVVLLNDFCDNALAATASAITTTRAKSLMASRAATARAGS